MNTFNFAQFAEVTILGKWSPRYQVDDTRWCRVQILEDDKQSDHIQVRIEICNSACPCGKIQERVRTKMVSGIQGTDAARLTKEIKRIVELSEMKFE